MGGRILGREGSGIADLAQSQIPNPKSLVISGASSGIGLALARHYLKCGAVVAAFARRGDLLQKLAAEFPGKVYCYTLDVRDAPAIQAAATDFMSHVGVPDIVIANAGVSRGTLTEYAEDEEVFQNIMDINVLGMVKTFQPFHAAMREAKQGTLVGIASVAGFRGLPGSGAYSASKAAAMSYLESLRVELHGSGVKVVTICPGYIKTPMTDINTYPMPFILEADEAARRMARAIERGASFSVVPWQMGLTGWLLKRLPNWIYDPVFSKAPHKSRDHQ
ncbi:2-(R)-hydroxypropyl-CoM dehydrogenase [mine drainage metagenome]|uniref:2-(R)-hydroxypropyl-CoM dehydrogenase n=1 Tax=mine drainage metagenome TaxID=410659 RepID=A0A1J5SPN5_9ZZZZ